MLVSYVVIRFYLHTTAIIYPDVVIYEQENATVCCVMLSLSLSYVCLVNRNRNMSGLSGVRSIIEQYSSVWLSEVRRITRHTAAWIILA